MTLQKMYCLIYYQNTERIFFVYCENILKKGFIIKSYYHSNKKNIKRDKLKRHKRQKETKETKRYSI